MIEDKNRLYDGWLSLEGGVDAGRAPNTINVNQVESAINMTFRGGNATTRPGFRKITESFTDEGVVPPTDQVWCFNEKHQYNPTADTFIFSVNLTMADPGTGHVRSNSHYWTILNQFAISGTTHTGQDARAFFRNLNPGNVVFMVDQANIAFYARFQLIAKPIDHGTWFLLQVGHPDIFGGAGPADTDILKIAFPDFGAAVDLYIEGEYKTSGRALSNPDPPYDAIAPWFVNENSEYVYRNGIMQSACAYSPHNGQDCIVALIGGRLFKIIPETSTATVTELVISGDDRDLRNRNDFPMAFMTQADKWLIAQDDDSGAIIYDASTARRAATTTDILKSEIPTGSIMAYGMGRLTVIVNKRDVAFGDLYGSHAGDDPADSLILFTERNFIAEGFDAAIPFQQGVVTGAMFFPQLDTSTGNGQLMVFAERGAASFFVSIPRDQWKTSAFQVLSLLTTGMRGHRSISVVNEDLWFRSDDGVRSYRQARSEPSGWAHIPLSTNVRQFLENDSDWLLKYSSSIYFDNRVIFTTSPMWNQGRPCHAGMVVVDFDILSSFGQKYSPAWEGLWQNTGFLPVQLLTGTFKGVTRAFAFGLDSTGQNQLYEISKDDKDDFDGERISWELTSRAFDFQKLSRESTPFTENELYDGDLWLREIVE